MPLNDIATPLESAGTGLSGIATPLAKPSLQQRLEYGFDVETNLVGEGYRLLKAAVKSIGPTTFEEEREDIEEERLEAERLEAEASAAASSSMQQQVAAAVCLTTFC